MTLNTSTRLGYADVRLAGVQFHASNLHTSNRDQRWATGVFADGWRKPNGKLTWWVTVHLLGFGIGACR